MRCNLKRKHGSYRKKSTRNRASLISLKPLSSPIKKSVKMTTRKRRNKRVRKSRKLKLGGLGPTPPSLLSPKTIYIKILFLPNEQPTQYYSAGLTINNIPESLGKNINLNNTFDDTDKFFFEQSKDTFDELFKNKVSSYYPDNKHLQTAIRDFFKNYTENCEVKEIKRGIPHYTFVFIENNGGVKLKTLKEITARAVVRNQNKDKNTQALLKDEHFLNVHPSLKYLPCRKLPMNDKDVGQFERDWDDIF